MSTTRKLILYALYFLMIVALGATVIVAFTHHSATKTPVVKVPTTIHQPVNSPAEPEATTTSTATNTSGESVKSAIAAANGSTQLTNTGPGDTLALFGVTVIASSYLYRRRQISHLVK